MADSEKRSVKISREELESLVLKPRGRTRSSMGVWWLYAACVLCVVLLIVTVLPQATVDSWLARLQSGSQAVSQSPLVNPEKLELIGLDDEWASPLFSVSGVVRSHVNEPLAGVQAVIKLYGKNGLITTLVVDLDAPALGPHQKGGFRASYKHTQDTDPLTHYDLSFQLKDGTPMLHQDLRGVVSNQ